MSLVAAAGFKAKPAVAVYVSRRESGPFDVCGNTASGISALAARQSAVRCGSASIPKATLRVRTGTQARKWHLNFKGVPRPKRGTLGL